MKKTMPLPPYIRNTIRRLNESGYEAYVVGGAVRSWLLGAEIHDYDIASSATPDEIKAVFSDHKIIDTGIRHGTVTLLEKKNPIEITTFRTETQYTDHRHPDQVRFVRTLEADCARRDFTINALAYHPREGILDFFGGVQDLQDFIIRAVGDPARRFEEDALRILRAIRFAAQLGFAVEENTRAALLEKQNTISFVSQERITSELIRTLSAPYFKGVLDEYRSVFELIIPELYEYSSSQWSGILMNVSRSPSDPPVRMALLLDGLNDSARAEEILRRLKYSNIDCYAVVNLLETRNMPVSDRIEMRKAMNRLTVPVSSFIDFRCARDTRLDKTELTELYRQIVRDNDCYTFKQLEVTGRDFKSLDLKGTQISAAMNACLLAVMEERVANRRDDLLAYLRELYSPHA